MRGWWATRSRVSWRRVARGAAVGVACGWCAHRGLAAPAVPAEAGALLGALRIRRDRAMVLAMLLGGLRRCEMLGLGVSDIKPGEQRLLIAHGKGGRERIVPVSSRFFTALGEYLELERPADAVGEACFVVLKGPPARAGVVGGGAGRGARGRAGASRTGGGEVPSAAAYVYDAAA